MPLPSNTAALPWADRFQAVRQRSLALCAPLAIEDHVPQPVDYVSPPKWHLAHATWFFETLVLPRLRPGLPRHHPRYDYLFNSYYESLGQRVARAQRGTLSRPTVAEILAYRAQVDAWMLAALRQDDVPQATLDLITLGLQHEQQHQELLLTDIKFILGHNPLMPPYAVAEVADIEPAREHVGEATAPLNWHEIAGGTHEIGHIGEGFCFDNEQERHTCHLRPFRIASRLVSNQEYMAFMADGGYQRAEFWHAEAWDWLAAEGVQAPMYWFRHPDAPGSWWHYSLAGAEPLPPHAPVSHLSHYEACAYAQWAGARLPTEFEWEASAPRLDWGQRWEWTDSAYKPYPGFKKAAGAVGEYNGKFMVNQQVLRGASFATPPGHARPTYRNFFHPHLRWQYTGIRLTRDD